MLIRIAILIFALAPTSAISEENDICACKKPNEIILVENLTEEQYKALDKFENDLFCTQLDLHRVDNLFRIDKAFCLRDENT